PDYVIAGTVVGGSMNVSYTHGGKTISLAPKALEAKGSDCGPFSLELRVWDRDLPNIKRLADVFSISAKEIREELDLSSGVFIYRDHFRVLPYGDPKLDWLRLDLRRVQNPTMRVSNNQVVGVIMISADKNPELRDQSNREGLVASPQ